MELCLLHQLVLVSAGHAALFLSIINHNHHANIHHIIYIVIYIIILLSSLLYLYCIIYFSLRCILQLEQYSVVFVCLLVTEFLQLSGENTS